MGFVKAKVSWQYDHFPKVAANLGKAGDAVAMQLAERIAETARELAPVVTGQLRDSIHAEAQDGGAIVATDVPYAAYVEYGHMGVPPQPFLLQAAVAHEHDGDLGGIVGALL